MTYFQFMQYINCGCFILVVILLPSLGLPGFVDSWFVYYVYWTDLSVAVSMDGIPTIETPVAKTGWKGLEFVASFTLWDPKNSAMEEILKSHWIGWREQKTTGKFSTWTIWGFLVSIFLVSDCSTIVAPWSGTIHEVEVISEWYAMWASDMGLFGLQHRTIFTSFMVSHPYLSLNPSNFGGLL
jgi:hypothetical protein